MTTLGLDYASIDGNATPDFSTAKRAGVRFAIPRAVYGRPANGGMKAAPLYIDPVWARDKNAILAAGLKRSAYLFVCFPKAGIYTPPPEVQAQAFIDYVELNRGDLVPFFDVEEASSVISPEAMYQWILVVASLLREHYGAWPGMYTSARVWNENLKNHSPGPLLNCPLWLAKPWPWATRTPIHLDGAPAYSPKPIPEFGSQWFNYQYQGDAIDCPGFNKTVDANRWRVFGQGSRGAHVAWAQARLGIKTDGAFGPATKFAVEQLQKEHGLDVDGIIGLDTFTPLCWSNPAPL